MAAYNDFVTQNASSKSVDADVAARFCGAPVKKVAFSFEKATGDIDASVWRVARISPYAKVMNISLACDSMASLVDLDIGCYKPLEVGGAVIDKDCFKDGLNPSAGIGSLTTQYVITIADVGKEAYLIAGVTASSAAKYGAFDIALTGNTAGVDIGTISGTIEYIE